MQTVSHQVYYNYLHCPHSLNELCSESFTNNDIPSVVNIHESKLHEPHKKLSGLFSCCGANERKLKRFEGEINFESYEAPCETVVIKPAPLDFQELKLMKNGNCFEHLSNDNFKNRQYQQTGREGMNKDHVVHLPSSPKGDVNAQTFADGLSNTDKIIKKDGLDFSGETWFGATQNSYSVPFQTPEYDLNLILDKKIEYIKEIKDMLNENKSLAKDKLFIKLVKQAIITPILIKNVDKGKSKTLKLRKTFTRNKLNVKKHSKSNPENNQNNSQSQLNENGAVSTSICDSNNCTSISSSFTKFYHRFKKPFGLRSKPVIEKANTQENWNGLSYSSRDNFSTNRGIMDNVSNSGSPKSKHNKTDDQITENPDQSLLFDSVSIDKSCHQTDFKKGHSNINKNICEDNKVENSVKFIPTGNKDPNTNTKCFETLGNENLNSKLDTVTNDVAEYHQTFLGNDSAFGTISESKILQSGSIECLTVIDSGDISHEFTEINELLKKYANNSDVLKDVDYFDLSSSCSSLHDLLNSASDISDLAACDKINNRRQLYDITEEEEPRTQKTHKSSGSSITKSAFHHTEIGSCSIGKKKVKIRSSASSTHESTWESGGFAYNSVSPEVYDKESDDNQTPLSKKSDKLVLNNLSNTDTIHEIYDIHK